ncbi:hypothetical protein BC835DRAFT_1323317 [Cytidiella melzeri]|nr:hypothetical protein BC835DRAFT_1323317 [Cytidiella melzeri]
MDIVPTFGATLLGCLGMMGLYGITCAQSFAYFVFYPDDNRRNKALVWTLLSLDTVHVVFVCHAMFHYLILNYSNPIALTTGTWSLWASILVNCLTSCLVQTFFTFRLYVLSEVHTRRWLIPLVVSLATICSARADLDEINKLLVVFAHLVFGIETAIQGLIQNDFGKFSTKIYVSALPFAVFAVLSDFLIAICLCVKLHKTKSYLMTGNTAINHLIIFAVNRCLLTAGVAVLEITLFAVFPNALWYLALDFAIGKLYANSVLATLNTRHSLRVRGGRRVFSPGNKDKSSGMVHSTGPTFEIPSGADRTNNAVFSTVLPVVSNVDRETIEQDGMSMSDSRSNGDETVRVPVLICVAPVFVESDQFFIYGLP